MTVPKPMCQLNGLNKLLEAIYEEPVTVDKMLLQVGLNYHETEVIKDEFLSEFVETIAENLFDQDTATIGYHRQHLIITHFYGLLTGVEEDDYKFGGDVGVCGERIKQLREKGLHNLRQEAWKKSFEESLYTLAKQFIEGRYG